MFKILNWAAILAVALLVTQPAYSAKYQNYKRFQQVVQSDSGQVGDFDLAQAEEDYPISASQAASIAQDTVPGSKVLKVKLLPSGVYAVTLKESGNVSRVKVDAKTGDII